jgi:hypothetical protein
MRSPVSPRYEKVARKRLKKFEREPFWLLDPESNWPSAMCLRVGVANPEWRRGAQIGLKGKSKKL